MNTAAKVAQHKEKNPHLYCPMRRCLWRTGGSCCPRHQPMKTHMTLEEARQIVREEKAGRAGAVNAGHAPDQINQERERLTWLRKL
jgi:hypothetical protein